MFMFVLLYTVYTYVILVILETSRCIYVFVVVEGMCTCKTRNFGNKLLCLYLCCCIGYLHMNTGYFSNENFSLFLIEEGMCTCKTRHFGK